MADEPSPVVRPMPGADPTPERHEILHERGIEPIGGTTPARHNTALIFAGTAMVLGILWVNSGTGQQSSSRDLTAPAGAARERPDIRSEEHTSELQSLMRNSSAVFCLKKNNTLSTA